MTGINMKLAEKQGLDEDDIEYLGKLHQNRKDLFAWMESMDSYSAIGRESLKLGADLLESIEFNMQRTWKFPQDSDFHSWWFYAPHCRCPKLDNQDYIGTQYNIISAECPIHGQPIKKEAT